MPDTATAPGPHNTTLGILAGGRGTRLGGVDKAWLQRDGVPQVLRCANAFRDVTCAVLVSANHALDRYRECSLAAVADAGEAGRGPIGGLQAIVDACRTEWLFTVPVDLVRFDPAALLHLMGQASAAGAFASDADGVQPLVALWPTARLRTHLQASQAPSGAIHELQAQLSMQCVPVPHLRLGNLNSPADLRAAGIRVPGGHEA